MKVPYTILLLALSNFSSAFIVSNGTANGLYIHKFHENGTSTHRLLSSVLTTDIIHLTSLRIKLPKRTPPTRYEPPPDTDDGWGGGKYDVFIGAANKWHVNTRRLTHCGNNHDQHYKVNQTDFDAAVALFKAGCKEDVDLGNDGNDFYVVAGEVVMFMCNWGKHGQWCKPWEMRWALENVKGHCGDGGGEGLNTGWFNYFEWAKGYGFDKVGNKVCRE